MSAQFGRVPLAIRRAGLEAEWRQRLRDGFDYCGHKNHVGSRWIAMADMAAETTGCCKACRNALSLARKRQRTAVRRMTSSPAMSRAAKTCKELI